MVTTKQTVWNKQLAFVAWSMFVASFFLPAYDTLRGFQCAIGQSMFWDQAVKGDWSGIHYELLTLANLMMILSPWLLYSFAKTAARLKGVWIASLVSTVLVWWFIGRIVASPGDRHSIRIGCILWTLSFGLLSRAIFPVHLFRKPNRNPLDQTLSA